MYNLYMGKIEDINPWCIVTLVVEDDHSGMMRKIC